MCACYTILQEGDDEDEFRTDNVTNETPQVNLVRSPKNKNAHAVKKFLHHHHHHHQRHPHYQHNLFAAHIAKANKEKGFLAATEPGTTPQGTYDTSPSHPDIYIHSTKKTLLLQTDAWGLEKPTVPLTYSTTIFRFDTSFAPPPPPPPTPPAWVVSLSSDESAEPIWAALIPSIHEYPLSEERKKKNRKKIKNLLHTHGRTLRT